MTRPDASRGAKPGADAGAAGRAADVAPLDRLSRPGHVERLPDGRDPRVVGSQDDGPLESLGKAIFAPVASADGDAERPAGGG